jgi:hypothetical protein
MALDLKIDMDEFRRALISRVTAAGYTVGQLQTLHTAVKDRTESQANGDAIARIVSLAMFAACEPRDEVNSGPVSVFLEDRITGQVVPKP